MHRRSGIIPNCLVEIPRVSSGHNACGAEGRSDDPSTKNHYCHLRFGLTDSSDVYSKPGTALMGCSAVIDNGLIALTPCDSTNTPPKCKRRGEKFKPDNREEFFCSSCVPGYPPYQRRVFLHGFQHGRSRTVNRLQCDIISTKRHAAHHVRYDLSYPISTATSPRLT